VLLQCLNGGVHHDARVILNKSVHCILLSFSSRQTLSQTEEDA
jgi:hypothetical protein